MRKFDQSIQWRSTGGWNSGLFTLAIAAACLTGCQSPNSSSGDFAYVTINNQSPARIQESTRAVFREHGYSELPGSGGEMVFEIRGSRMNEVVYGDWLNSSVWVRVNTRIHQLSPSSQRLECEAYVVRHRDDLFFEDTQRLRRARSAPYQEMLGKVKDRLGG